MDHHRLVARSAAGLALFALLVGGVSQSVVAGGTNPALLQQYRFIALLGPAALVALSVFDAFTVPGLHHRLSPHGPALTLIATGCALLGDTLGAVGRSLQHAAVQVALEEDGGVAGAWQLAQRTVNSVGFLLVALSFSSFGLLFWRAGVRWLGGVAVLAGLLTGLGQIAGWEGLFYAANLFFVAWYAGLIRQFRSDPLRHSPPDSASSPRQLAPSKA